MLSTRRDFLKKIGIGAASLSVPNFLISCQKQKNRPNIIFIMSDDHAAHAISCYGSKINKTPNIDRLASEGIQFDNCFCTNSICAPSRAVILTGKYSHLNGVVNNNVPMDVDQPTFPKLLRQAGYQTALIGKWHLKSEPTGFDYWHVLPGQGDYVDPEMNEMGNAHKRKGYVTNLITDDALGWLNRRDKKRPFCLLVQHKAPHMPWISDEKHAGMYENVVFETPETFNAEHDNHTDAIRTCKSTLEHDLVSVMDWKVPDGLNKQERKNWIYQKYIKVYLRSIASVDDNVGRILDYLDENALVENTVVVYTSDQGFFLGEHGLLDKRFMYEESLRMPLLMRYPKDIQPKRVNKDMVLNLDFAPTFLDLAGIPVSDKMQGVSFLPLINGKVPTNWRRSMYYHYSEQDYVAPHYGLRTERYKLMHFYTLKSKEKWELFDLQADPKELYNVYDDPAYAERVGELQKELTYWKDFYQDSTPEAALAERVIKIDHLAVGRPVMLTNPCYPKYSGGSKNPLTDGIVNKILPYWAGDYTHWMGFEEVDLQAVLDLGKATSIRRIAAGFLQSEGSWIFLPTQVTFDVSTDGKNFKEVASLDNKIPPKRFDYFREEFETKLHKICARYIRVTARNLKTCPDWHAGAGGKAWIFADEIIVE